MLCFGLIIILFVSVFIFTREVIWDTFDYSNTGEIGDTIGGITAPVINLIGAILIFISFKAQINANEIQTDLINKELENQKQDRNFQVTFELFKMLKEDFNNLSFKEYEGHSALNVFANEVKKVKDKNAFSNHSKKPIYHEWKFLINEYNLILFHIESSEFRSKEKEKIKKVVKSFFHTHLSYPTGILKEYLIKYKISSGAIIKSLEDLEKLNDSV